MPTMEIQVRRYSVISPKSFEEVVNKVSATIGQPDMKTFSRALVEAGTEADLEQVVQAAIGPSELMEFARYDQGEVLRKEVGGEETKILRLGVGNPPIMKEMAKTVPDAG